MNKKTTILLIIFILLIVLILWVSGLIPKQFAKVYGTNYMKKNFPEMNLKYYEIEWSKYHGNYIITFIDANNQKYGVSIGPKFFPISIGEGLLVIIEDYSTNY